MIEYTIEEIKVLAGIYQKEYPIEDIHPFQFNFDFSSVLNQIINKEEEKKPNKILVEFINNQDFVCLDEDNKKKMLYLLFEAPLKDMLIYINSDSIDKWKSRISQWRLKIGK